MPSSMKTEVGDVIGIIYQGSSGSNYVGLGVENSDNFDGSDSIRYRYSSSGWATDSYDIRFEFKQLPMNVIFT